MFTSQPYSFSDDSFQFGTVYVISSKKVNDGVIRQFRDAFATFYNEQEVAQMNWVPLADSVVSGLVLVARRFNVGNIGRVATVCLQVTEVVESCVPIVEREDIVSSCEEELRQFADTLFNVESNDQGNWTITADLSNFLNFIQPIPLRDIAEQCDRLSPCRSIQCQIIKADEEQITSLDDYPWNEPDQWDELAFDGALPSPSATIPVDRLTQLEEQELEGFETEQERALSELRRAVLNYVLTYHADPSALMGQLLSGKYIVGDKPLSNLVVNKDMEIVLPAYDEQRVRMPALCKAIYILFLLHRKKGIVLSAFADHRKELEQIYALVMPNRDESLATVTLDNLCNPLSNTLNEYISKIKRCFMNVLSNEELCNRYIIAGARNCPYRINLPNHMVTLPKVFND